MRIQSFSMPSTSYCSSMRSKPVRPSTKVEKKEAPKLEQGRAAQQRQGLDLGLHLFWGSIAAATFAFQSSAIVFIGAIAGCTLALMAVTKLGGIVKERVQNARND